LRAADQPGAVPFGGEGYFTLPVVRAQAGEQQVLVSAWELNPAEVEEVARTGRIWLTVVGSSHPPVMLSTSCPYTIQLEEDPASDAGG
jgi:hypothetical protein